MVFDPGVEIDEGGGDFQPIPKGKYAMNVDKAEAGIAVKSGNTKAEIHFSVIGDFDDENVGRLVFGHYTLVGESTKYNGKILQLITAIASSGDDEFGTALQTAYDKVPKDEDGYPVHVDDLAPWQEVLDLIADCDVLVNVGIEISKDSQYPDKNVTNGFAPIES